MGTLKGLNQLFKDVLSGTTSRGGPEIDEELAAFILEQKQNVLDRLESITTSLKEAGGKPDSLRPSAAESTPLPARQPFSPKSELPKELLAIPLLVKLQRYIPVADVARVVEVPTYGVVYKNDAPARDLHFIVRGQVKIYQYTSFEQEILIDLPGSGDFFGLTSMFTGLHHEFCVAQKDTTLVKLSFKVIRDVIAQHPQFKKEFADLYRRELVNERVAATGIFSSLSLKERKELYSLFDVRFYKPEQVIIAEGVRQSRALYIVCRGAADVVTEVQERRILLNRLYEGDFFGEMSLLTRQLPNATVKANQLTELLVLSERNMNSVLESFPSVKRQLLAVRDQRMKMNKDILDDTEGPVSRETARVIHPGSSSAGKNSYDAMSVADLVRVADKEQLIDAATKAEIVRSSNAIATSTNKSLQELTLHDFQDLSVQEILEATYAKARQELEADEKRSRRLAITPSLIDPILADVAEPAKKH